MTSRTNVNWKATYVGIGSSKAICSDLGMSQCHIFFHLRAQQLVIKTSLNTKRNQPKGLWLTKNQASRFIYCVTLPVQQRTSEHLLRSANCWGSEQHMQLEPHQIQDQEIYTGGNSSRYQWRLRNVRIHT